MFIKKIELKNFRSYAHAVLDFPEGVTLLEGDVGSGKSSVLYAIEFALFGLGDLKSTHLLRHDAQGGFVKLDFEVNGKQYSIMRTLERRKDSARQGSGYVVDGGVKLELTPEELRREALRILHFKENPAPKATSWIYRYAVFTPQEAMKEILLLKKEERLHTLRKAFGVEEYKTASENALVAARSFKEDERFMAGQTADLLQVKKRLEETIALHEEKLVDSRAKNELVQKKQAELDALRYALENTRALIEQKNILSKEIPLLKQREADFARQKRRLEEENAQHAKMPEPARPAVSLEDEKTLRAIHAKRLEESRAKTTLLAMLKTEEKNHSQLKHKGVCPTCGQGVSTFSEAKLFELNSRIKQCESELSTASASEEEARAALEKASRNASLVQLYENERKRFEEAGKRIASNEKLLAEISEKMLDLEQQIEAKGKTLEELAAKAKDVELLVENESVFESELRRLVEEHSSAKALAERLAKEKEQLEREVKEKQEKEKQLAACREKRVWLEECFQPAVANIEQHVLAKLNNDFAVLFRKWFALLVESPDLNVDVDETFTPVIEQNGYEQDFLALSGGEKSGLALAYRVALNSVVREEIPSLRDNLLILDEPTDGFSKEQLSRLRDLLHELRCRQVLIVSHERELEGFVDQVFKVEKRHGVSSVSSL